MPPVPALPDPNGHSRGHANAAGTGASDDSDLGTYADLGSRMHDPGFAAAGLSYMSGFHEPIQLATNKCLLSN
jgi:hypothetical protein